MSDPNTQGSIFKRPLRLPAIPPTRLSFVEVCSLPITLFLVWVVLGSWLGGFYTRMMGDDYYFGPYVRQYGFWGSWVQWYFTWYGRWFSQILLNGVFTFGDWIVVVVPTVLLGLWTLSLAGAVRCATGWPLTRVARFVVLLLGLTLLTTPQLPESFYWSASSLFHTLPLTLCGFIVPCLWGSNTSPLRLSITSLLAFCLSGTSESFTIVWVPTLLLVAVWHRDRYSVCAFLAALAGALMMLLAPGNAVRAATSAPHWAVPRLIERSLELGQLFLTPAFPGALFPALMAAFVLGFISGTGRLSVRWHHLAWCAAFVVFSAVATQAPSVYGTGRIPAARVMIIPAFFVSGGMLTGVVLLGSFFRGHRRQRNMTRTSYFTLAGCLLLFSSLYWMRDFAGLPWQRLVTIRDFCRLWTARNQSLHQQIAQGHRVIIVQRLGWPFLADVTSDPNHYVNAYMALRYSPSIHNPVKIIGKTKPPLQKE